MKIICSILILTFCVQLSLAQKAPIQPQAPSVSHSSYEKKVDMNLEKEKRLKLAIDNDQFKLILTFPKASVKEAQKVFVSHFIHSKSNNYKWTSIDENARIELRKNKLKVFFKKGRVSQRDLNSIKAFTEETLELFDWDTEDMGL